MATVLHAAPARRGPLVVADLDEEILPCDRATLETYLELAASAPGAACVLWARSTAGAPAPELACVAHNELYGRLFAGTGALLGRPGPPLLADAWRAGLERTLVTGVGAQLEPLPIAVRDGDAFRTEYHAGTWLPAFDAGGHPRGVVVLLHDTTAHIERLRRFLGGAVHDLRQPLAAIGLLARTLAPPRATARPAKSGADPLRPKAQRIRELTEKMSLLVDQMASFSASAAARSIRIERRRCDLGAIVRAMGDELRALDEAPLVLETEPTPGLWDAGAMERLVSNLVSNARRHGPTGGNVTVRLTHRPKEALLEVLDEGAGIPPDELSRAFEPWQRGEMTAAHPGAGMGLGLFIAREIAEAHGGRITAVHRSPRGFAMCVSFPLSGSGVMRKVDG